MRKSLVIISMLFSMVFISCDQDFNTIGADLVGDEHFDFNKEVIEGNELKAYSIATDEVQTNNLHINPIGFYNNPYFGQTKANFVTQVTLGTIQPKFGTNVQIENVKLYIPYFSKVQSTNSDGSKIYKLDSIFGANPESKMRLNIYENGYYLNSFDANDQSQAAKYYNDINGLIDAQKRGAAADNSSITNGNRLNNSTEVSQNDQFYFSKDEIIVYKTKFNINSGVIEYVDANNQPLANQNDVSVRVVQERLAPGMYIDLNKEFFKKRILEASSDNLFNNNIFKEYFKGLYFQMEQIAGHEGAMAMINFSGAKLKINYNSIVSPETTASSKSLQLNLGSSLISNTVSLQDYAYSGAYSAGLFNPANVYGDATTPYGKNERLYLKGGKGSVVYIEIDQAKIDLLKQEKWLINDAYLEFYVDKTAMSQTNQEEAERIYLFDATNQKPLYDFYFDTSTSTNAKNNKSVHGGIIFRDDNGKGEKYKIRITQHINNILNSTNVNVNKNVKLGLCVTESIAIASNYYFKDKKLFNPDPSATSDDISIFPLASILSQQGTVLHGTHSTDPDKKLKLVIHYTKPN